MAYFHFLRIKVNYVNFDRRIYFEQLYRSICPGNKDN